MRGFGPTRAVLRSRRRHRRDRARFRGRGGGPRGPATRQRRALHHPPAGGRRHPGRVPPRRFEHLHRAAARHGRGYRAEAAAARGAVRHHRRRPGRRRHQADPAGAAVGPHQAGRELPQAGAGDEPRHTRAGGQARRPAAQHAHPVLRARVAPPSAHRVGDHGHLCAAGRPHRHGQGQDRAAGPVLRRAGARAQRHHTRPAELPARPGRRRDRGGATRAGPALRRRGRAAGGGHRAREVALLHLGEDAEAQRRFRAVVRHHGVPGHGADPGGLLRGAGRGARRLPDHHRPVQGLHLHAEGQRLPEPAHRRDPALAPQPEDRGADPHAGDARRGRQRRRRALVLQGARRVCSGRGRLRRGGGPGQAAALGAGPAGDPGEFHRPGRVPREHQARALPGPGVLLQPQGPADPAAARRHPGRLRLRRAQPDRRCLRRRQGQRPADAAAPRAAERRPGRDHDRPRRHPRRRPGNASSSPARRAPASAATSPPRRARPISTPAARRWPRRSGRKASTARRRCWRQRSRG